MSDTKDRNSKLTNLSRRSFLSLAAAGGASTLLKPVPAAAGIMQPKHLRDDYIGRLCYNENPLGPSPAAITAIIEQAAMCHRYTDWYADSLRSDLADEHGVTSSEIIAGNGATEILRLAAYAFSEPGTNVVCPYPSYSQFPSDVSAFGGEVRYADLDLNHRVDLAAVAALVDSDTVAVCLTNPNNPTGTVLPAIDIANFQSNLPGGVALLIDEAYHDFVEDPGYDSAMELVRGGEDVVVIRTFSKGFGLAGARIGYAVGAQSLISSIKSRQTWGTVSRPSLEAAKAALTDTQHIIDSVDLANQVKTYCFGEFDRLELEYIPSETSFFMVNVGDAGTVSSELSSRGIQVRTGWGMPNHLRVSVGTMPEMVSFITALEEIMIELSSVTDQPTTPQTTMLFGNQPNPVRSRTTIRYQIARSSEVELRVYDIRGRLVKTLVESRMDPGVYSIDWIRTDDRGHRLPAGSYFYRLRTNDEEQTRRLILI